MVKKVKKAGRLLLFQSSRTSQGSRGRSKRGRKGEKQRKGEKRSNFRRLQQLFRYQVIGEANERWRKACILVTAVADVSALPVDIQGPRLRCRWRREMNGPGDGHGEGVWVWV